MDEGQQQEQHNAAEDAINLQLDRLSDLQKQLAKASCSHEHEWNVECTGRCMCQEVPGHAAALEAAAAAAHAPLEAKQLLAIIRVMRSLGAVLIKGNHPLEVHLAATQALHSAAIIPAQQIMQPFIYKTLHQLSSFTSGEATLSELKHSMGKQRYSQFKLLSKGLPKQLTNYEEPESDLLHVFAEGMAALGTHHNLTDQLRRLKALQGLARTTQQGSYTTQAQQLAAKLSPIIAAAHTHHQQLQCVYVWASEVLAIWPHLPIDQQNRGKAGTQGYPEEPEESLAVVLLAASQLRFLSVLGQVSSTGLASTDSDGGSSSAAVQGAGSGSEDSSVRTTACSKDSSSSGGASIGDGDTTSIDNSGQLPALDASTAAGYRSLLSSICGMMCHGLCMACRLRIEPLPPFLESQGLQFASLSLPNHAKAYPDQMVLLSLTGIHNFGLQLLQAFEQQHSDQQKPGGDTMRAAASACSSSSSMGGASGAGTEYGTSSSSSSSSARDPWETAEGLLLLRADMLQSKTASTDQLAAVLGQAKKLYRQHWQQLGFPDSLYPTDCSGPTTTTTSSSSGGSGHDSDSSSIGGDTNNKSIGSGSSHRSGDSSKEEGSSSGGSSGSSSAASSCDLDPALLGLHDAVGLLMDVLEQHPQHAAVQMHAATASQMLLSAAAAALGLYGSAAAYVVDKCLTAALALLRSGPVTKWQDLTLSRSTLFSHLDPQLAAVQQQHLKQNSGKAQSYKAAADDHVSDRLTRQTLAMLLQILQQLRIALDQEHASQASDSSSTPERDSSSSTGGGRGGVGDKGKASSSSSTGRGVGSSIHDGTFASVNVVRCMLKSLTLSMHHLDAIMNSQSAPQLAKGLETPQHCEQLAAAFQVIEASVRSLWRVLNDPSHQSMHDTAPEQGGPQSVKFQRKEATSVVLYLMRMRVLSCAVLLPRLPRHHKQQPVAPAQHQKTVLPQQQQQQHPAAHTQNCWDVYTTTVHGQQLLQALLSLLLTVDKLNSTSPLPQDRSTVGMDDALPAAQQHLMQLVARDLRAHTLGCKPQQQQQQEQQQQQPQGQVSASSGTASHLPHPQLVSVTLGWAKQHYGKSFRFDTVQGATNQVGTPDALLVLSAKCLASQLLTGPSVESVVAAINSTGAVADCAAATPPAAAAAAASNRQSQAATATAAEASTSSSRRLQAAAAAATAPIEAVPCGDLVCDPEFDAAVTELLQALAGFVAAPLTSQGPTAVAWRDLLAVPAYGAAVCALNDRMQEYCSARDSRSVFEQQRTKTGTKGMGGVAVTAARAELDKNPQQQQQQRRAKTQHAAAAEDAAEASRFNWLLLRQRRYREAVRVWALLCAVAPSRHMCNGLLCRSMKTVSESFALVRGRACVCGCCVAKTAAHTSKELVCRYCSPECQLSAHPLHKLASLTGAAP